ncbi:amidase (plasmid) [Herbiconiux sp. KACC 21604]|uniref:amidase n=1 Tax=unclassified Herbiconiux TaxID=2618217 RepID=UPI001491D462|nr:MULTISPECIES: amidase [unclassified Herbiconiux]QJU56343.1 amidase [Herbiconiux sp. SALV-R1]WPO88850.1 amidase [Herbiconiux sp. KACC 21604]
MTSPDEELVFLPATELAAAYRRGTLSPVEVTEAILNRIERLDPQLNAFVTVTADAARAQARHAENTFRAAGDTELPPLLGVPVSVKDLEETAGVRTTYGSTKYADHVPDTDAVIWARLKAAGATLIGKTATPEFGNNSVTESELNGITRNPWNLEMTAGGSSGGAATAAAAGFGPIATGSDGGGSIRVPASFCGVVGLKPSAGRIPFNDRKNAYEEVTTTGPLTRTVADAALALSVTHGPDPYDPVSLLESGVDFGRGLTEASLHGVRIAFSPDLGRGPIARETARVIAELVGKISRDHGDNVDEVSLVLPDPIDYFYAYWSPIIALEIVHDLLDGRVDDAAREQYPLVRRAEQTTSLQAADAFLTTRTAIHNAFADVFQKYDVLVWPTTSSPAFPHPAHHGFPTAINGRQLVDPMLENQLLTEAIAHAGYPAISIPAGFTKDGLPVGLQIAAAHGRDDTVLKAAAAIESAYPWAHLRPLLNSTSPNTEG